MAIPLFSAAEVRSGAIRVEERLFDYRVYTNPHALSRSMQREVIELLSIPEARHMMNTREYSAVISVKARDISDMAVATLQYYDWEDTGQPQLWICDLVRRRDSGLKPPVSPVGILFDVVSMIAYEHEQEGIYLMVENRSEKLTRHYETYGFVEIPDEFYSESEIHMVRAIDYT
jgi:hypothetical protein